MILDVLISLYYTDTTAAQREAAKQDIITHGTAVCEC